MFIVNHFCREDLGELPKPQGLGYHTVKSMNERSRFIVFEGIDGAGKTTCARHLYHLCKENGIDVIYTSEPTHGFVGEILHKIIKRQLPCPHQEVLQVLFAADRQMHCKLINDWLENKKTVISDRYIFSTLAYNTQGIEAQKFVIQKHEVFYIVPDYIIWCTCDPKLAIKRLNHDNIFDNEKILRQASQRYADMFIYSRLEHFSPLFRCREKTTDLYVLSTDGTLLDTLKRIEEFFLTAIM